MTPPPPWIIELAVQQARLSPWLVREYSDPPPFRILPKSDPPPMRGIDRVFHRQDYAYPPGFIGPHRAPEYHEARR